MRGAGCRVATLTHELALEGRRPRIKIDLTECFRLGRNLKDRTVRAHQRLEDGAANREVVVRVRYADPSTPRVIAARTHGGGTRVRDRAGTRCGVERLRDHRLRLTGMNGLSRMQRKVPVPNPRK